MKCPKFQIGDKVNFICHMGDRYRGRIVGIEIAYSEDYLSNDPQYGYRIAIGYTDVIDVIYASEENMRLEALDYMKARKNETV